MSLCVRGSSLRQLPTAVEQATRLTRLHLDRNRSLKLGPGAVLRLLRALPALRDLDLRGTPAHVSACELAEAAARGIALQAPDPPSSSEDDGYLDGPCDSSESDSSDDGCPRYSWAGCAYASRCADRG